MKTFQEIEALKSEWLQNPAWDIYLTDGFEAHALELYNFQKAELSLGFGKVNEEAMAVGASLFGRLTLAGMQVRG